MTHRFKEGDRVRLTEAGPTMAVQGYDQAGRVVCSWYETKLGWRRESYDEERVRDVYRRARPDKAKRKAPKRLSLQPADTVAIARIEQVLGLSVAEARHLYDRLTPRQLEVASLLARGLTNPTIAGKMGISEKTLHIHRADVLHKLRTKSSAGVARIVYLVELAEGAAELPAQKGTGRKNS